MRNYRVAANAALLLFLLRVVLSGFVDPTAYAQDASHIQLAAIDGNNQSTPVGRAFPRPLRVRLTDTSGVPFVSAEVSFEVYDCTPVVGTGCYGAGSPGRFASGGSIASAYTDANGVATSPTLYAGDHAGWVQASALVAPNQPPYFFGISDALHHILAFNLVQTTGARAVPLAAPTGLAALVAMIACVSLFALRRRRIARLRHPR